MCVMSGLERRISLTLRNDYGNNMIICLLSLSSFFLTANPRCCEMGEDFSEVLSGQPSGGVNGPSLHPSPLRMQLHLVLPA